MAFLDTPAGEAAIRIGSPVVCPNTDQRMTHIVVGAEARRTLKILMACAVKAKPISVD